MSLHHATVASALAVVAMLTGPTWFVATGDELRGLPAWRMFEDAGLGVCDVQFADETGRALDRYRAHGVPHRFVAPDALFALDDPEAARGVARSFCPEVDRVDITMRCATPEGWRPQPVAPLRCSRP